MALGDGEVDGRDHELRAADDHEGERRLNLAARLAKREPGHRDRHDPVDRAVNRRVPRPETRASVEPVGESRGRGTAETQAWLHDNGRVLKMLTGTVSKRQAADLQTFKRLVEAGDADGDVAQGQGIHLLAQAGFKTETSD